ncbi:MAG TPA: hypothetical protein VGI19_16585 [Candidatus Cybelea sp.]
MFERRHWIPPGGLLFAQACHGLSWLLLLWIALTAGVAELSMPALTWIHLVALGWFTVAALSVLLFAIPQMADQPWRYEGATRTALGWFAAGVAFFVLALFVATRFVGLAAAFVYVTLLVYLLAAWTTLAQRRQADRAERAIARAFFITLLVLGIVATLGLILALSLSGIDLGVLSSQLPAAHGNLGFFGWLSLLVYGVSTRTVRPSTGSKPSRLTHIVVGTATLAGALALAAGLGVDNPIATWTGAVLIGLGAVVYCVDMASVIARATVPHRPPQAFIAAAITWLLVALAFGASALAGYKTALAFGFVILVGWIGQMVNAHIFHIGTRVIATVYRGEDDETQPEELLDQRLEWAAFACFQGAIILVALGLWLGYAPPVAIGAIAGGAGWLAMIANLNLARSRALPHVG